MVKVAFFVNSLIKAGPVNVVYDIIINIDRNAFEPIVFVLRNYVEYRSLLDKFKEINVEVIFLDFSLLTMELHSHKCSRIVESILDEREIKIVHAHSYHAAIILSKCCPSIKKIVTFHNICVEDFSRQKGMLLGCYMSIRYLMNVKKFDKKVGISKIVTEFYKERVGSTEIETIYNGIDCRQFHRVSREQYKSSRSEMGIYNETVYIIVGTLSKRKNVLYVIESIKKIHDSSKIFFFVGTGPLVKKCMRRAAGHENIKFTGYQMDISKYLSIADFSIAASKSEGFGLAALEAVLSGVTLIYSDCAAFQELFSENPDLRNNMFTLKNAESLVEQLRMCQKARNTDSIIEYYKKKFDSALMSKKYQYIYSHL